MEYTYEERHAILDRLEAHAMKRNDAYSDDPYSIKKLGALWWLIGYLGASITDEELANIKRQLDQGSL